MVTAHRIQYFIISYHSLPEKAAVKGSVTEAMFTRHWTNSSPVEDSCI